jgi:Response regulator containing a CheY-like receiver domain and an HTH DNA-binding domain
MDITMPEMDGVETTKWLKQNNYKIKVIALSMLKNDMIIIRMLKNGARGYLLKDCDTAELKQAISDVYYKGYYYNEFLNDKRKSINSQEEVMINEKEFTFLKLCCTDKSYKEIADVMCVSPRTVDGYRDALFQKLDVTSRIGLAIYAIKNDIVQV